MDWYGMDPSKALASLGSSDQGLGEGEARKRLNRYGLNKFTEQRPPSRTRIFIHQFTNPLIYILLLAVVVIALLEQYKDSFVILAVLLFNAVTQEINVT